MGNRKQPFGYKMSLGEIVIQESEAKLVQEIFLRYIAGESLNELTESLRQQDIPYDEGRLWNKNMVARILADARYTGEKEYPKLIDKEQLIATNEKRSNKPQLPKKTEAQKVLRRLCGTPPSEQVEQSVTYLLNGLANYPDRIQHRRSPSGQFCRGRAAARRSRAPWRAWRWGSPRGGSRSPRCGGRGSAGSSSCPAIRPLPDAPPACE